MKTNILPILLLSCSTLVVSCSDFLTEDPKGQMIEQNYFGSQSELDGAVNVLMAQVQFSLSSAHAMAPNWMGDDITALVAAKDVFKEFDVFDVKNNNADTKIAWNKNYSIIKAANFIINNASKTPVSEEEINIGLGQGYFWRAFAYLKLVRWYGEVPLVLSTELDFNIPKASLEDIYNRIDKDLELAIGYLPYKYDKSPRITNDLNNYANKGAAKAVRVAAFMARAGYPLNQTKYYSEAASLARNIIEETKENMYYYLLEDNYKNKYNYVTNNYSKEGIVAVKYNKDNPGWWLGTESQLGVAQAYESVSNQGWGDAVAEIAFWKDMPDGPRKETIYGGENGKILVYKGKKLIDWYQKDESGNYICKEAHPMFRTLLTGADGEKDEIMIDYDYTKSNWPNALSSQTLYPVTYNEILLWYGEALARSGGSIDQLAKESLQKILDRAYGAGEQSAETYASSADDFAEKCFLEHGYEVAGYFPALVSRANDLLRMNRLKDVFEMRKQNAAVEVATGVSIKEPVEVTGSWNDQRNYATIPSFDSDLNENLK